MQVSWLDFELVEGLASAKVPVLDAASVYRWDLALELEWASLLVQVLVQEWVLALAALLVHEWVSVLVSVSVLVLDP